MVLIKIFIYWDWYCCSFSCGRIWLVPAAGTHMYLYLEMQKCVPLNVYKGRILYKPPFSQAHTYRANHLLGVNPPRRTLTYSPSPQKEDFKEVLPLMPLRANQVYRRGDWSQVDFKHRSDPGHLENLHYSSFGEVKFFLHIGLPVF